MRAAISATVCLITFLFAGGQVASAASDAQTFDRLYRASLPFFFASDVANECKSIRMKRKALQTFDKWLKTETKKAGLKHNAFMAELNKVPQRKIDSDMGAFIKKYGIKPKDRASWCAAGAKMIAGNDAVGRYLVAK